MMFGVGVVVFVVSAYMLKIFEDLEGLQKKLEEDNANLQ